MGTFIVKMAICTNTVSEMYISNDYLTADPHAKYEIHSIACFSTSKTK